MVFPGSYSVGIIQSYHFGKRFCDLMCFVGFVFPYYYTTRHADFVFTPISVIVAATVSGNEEQITETLVTLGQSLSHALIGLNDFIAGKTKVSVAVKFGKQCFQFVGKINTHGLLGRQNHFLLQP